MTKTAIVSPELRRLMEQSNFRPLSSLDEALARLHQAAQDADRRQLPGLPVKAPRQR